MNTITFEINDEQTQAMRAGKLTFEVSCSDGEITVQEIRDVRD